MSGYFFVFDGMDGSGKSTALSAVAANLKNQGFNVTTTREPGGSPLAERLRECMLADWSDPVPIQAELLMVFAARAAHMQQTVLPALQRGEVVLCDRFVDSSHVYQGTLGGLQSDWIDTLEKQTVTRAPDQVFIFDLPVDLAMARMQQRNHNDRFDKQGQAVQMRMRQAYLERSKVAGRCLINASQAAEDLAQDVSTRIRALMS